MNKLAKQTRRVFIYMPGLPDQFLFPKTFKQFTHFNCNIECWKALEAYLLR